jgi:hypothetical protein
MRIIELVLVLGAAAAFALWRGIAMYKQSFRKNL